MCEKEHEKEVKERERERVNEHKKILLKEREGEHGNVRHFEIEEKENAIENARH